MYFPSDETISEITHRVSSGDAYLAKGNLSQSYQEYYSALRLVEAALNENPSDTNLSDLKLSCLIKCGWSLCQDPNEVERAFTYSSAALKLSITSPAAHCLHAVVCSAMGNTEEALQSMQLAECLDKENIAYGYNLSLMYAKIDSAKAASYKETTERKCPGFCTKAGGKFLLDALQNANPENPTDAKEQYMLGKRYYDGDGVEQNYQIAVEWYKKAAEQGYARAQYNLAQCYMFGRGVEKDERVAVEWYKKAAEQGIPEAQSNLGGCYDNGTGVEKDETKAVEWYKKAAEQRDARAQYNLGVCYMFGRGVKKDERMAVEWYKKAAEQEIPEAQYNLAQCYMNGRGVEKDERMAVEWYKKAAEQGHVTAQRNLGWCYEEGIGVKKNEKRAVKWYKKAAERGDTCAQSALKRYESKHKRIFPWSRK